MDIVTNAFLRGDNNNHDDGDRNKFRTRETRIKPRPRYANFITLALGFL